MSEERIITAVERIDGAMTRIEAAAARQVPAPTDAMPADAVFADLRERHDAMRSRVESAVAELDMLIRNG